MAWQITGTYYAPCSCKVGCPCALGELEADQGWCSAVMAVDIRSGNADGVDLGGTRVALVVDWPGGFLSGNGTGRMYFPPGISGEQQAALEGIVGGQRGGVFEAIAALVPDMQPSERAPVAVQAGAEESRITVGDGAIADLVVKPLRGPTGEATTLLHGAAAFRDEIVLAKATGGARAGGMRQWQSAGHGEMSEFDWSA